MTYIAPPLLAPRLREFDGRAGAFRAEAAGRVARFAAKRRGGVGGVSGISAGRRALVGAGVRDGATGDARVGG